MFYVVQILLHDVLRFAQLLVTPPLVLYSILLAILLA